MITLKEVEERTNINNTLRTMKEWSKEEVDKAVQDITDECNKTMKETGKSFNEIAMFIDYEGIIDKCEDRGIEIRVCSECNKLMISGYIIGSGEDYYCSDCCLYDNYSAEDCEEMYDNGVMYYTDWYEPEIDD